MTEGMRQLQRLVDLAGLEAAFTLAGFYGGAHRRIRVPVRPDPKHQLCRLIGADAFTKLVAAIGGKLLPVPDLMPEMDRLRTAGRVETLKRHGVSPPEIARIVGVSRSRAGQLLNAERHEKNTPFS